MYPAYNTPDNNVTTNPAVPSSSMNPSAAANLAPEHSSAYYNQLTSDPIYAAYLAQYYSTYDASAHQPTGPVDLDSVIVKSQSTRKKPAARQHKLSTVSDEPVHTPSLKRKSSTAPRNDMNDEPHNDQHDVQDGTTGGEPVAKKKKLIRYAAGKVWEDKSLMEWPENDFRLFVGDLGPEVVTQTLESAFNKYPSFQKAYVVRDPKTLKSKGYGFVSFLNAEDYTKAFREYDNKYLGSRPVKLRKSAWQDRNIEKKKEKLKRIFG